MATSTTQTTKNAKGKPIGWLFSVIVTLVVATVINKVSIRWFGFQWSTALNFVNYFAVYLLILWLVKKYNLSRQYLDKGTEIHPAYNWPLPKPIAQFGKLAPAFTYFSSLLLSLFNPYLLCQQIRQLIGQFQISKRLKDDPDYFNDFTSEVQYRLPFNDEWLIYHGGHTPTTSHSWDVVTQRFAYDFVKADQQFSRHSAEGRALHQYYCYDQAILAAADGEVVKVIDGLPDGLFVGYFIIDFLAKNLAGNHVIIKHAEGEYGFYAHLLQSSIPVRVGDKVRQGQIIGKCGFSGNGTEPHLHFHLQDGINFYHSLGLPIKFHRVRVNNGITENNCILERGSRVQHDSSV